MHLPMIHRRSLTKRRRGVFLCPKRGGGTQDAAEDYQQEILALIHSGLPQAELAEKLSDYHENDLADALQP